MRANTWNDRSRYAVRPAIAAARRMRCWWLGRAELEAGDLGAARGRFGDVLRTFRDFEMREELADCLEDHTVLACLDGDPQTAVRIASATQAYRQRRGLVLSPFGQRRWDRRLRMMREALQEPAFSAAWTEGGATELDDAISAVRALSSSEPAYVAPHHGPAR